MLFTYCCSRLLEGYINGHAFASSMNLAWAAVVDLRVYYNVDSTWDFHINCHEQITYKLKQRCIVTVFLESVMIVVTSSTYDANIWSVSWILLRLLARFIFTRNLLMSRWSCYCSTVLLAISLFHWVIVDSPLIFFNGTARFPRARQTWNFKRYLSEI